MTCSLGSLSFGYGSSSLGGVSRRLFPILSTHVVRLAIIFGLLAFGAGQRQLLRQLLALDLLLLLLGLNLFGRLVRLDVRPNRNREPIGRLLPVDEPALVLEAG